MKRSTATILREYGPFPGVDCVHGVSYDGQHVWLAVGATIQALDPESGAIDRAIAVPATAGTAFDGTHLFQIDQGRIRKIDLQSGQVIAELPVPCGDEASGLAWGEGSLWVGHYRARKIYEIDPHTGKVLRTLASDRFVTGVTWASGELWHGTWENDASELRQIDPNNGDVLASLVMPPGTAVSGLESDGGERFFCGGGLSGQLRSVKKPARDETTVGNEPEKT